MTRLDKIREKLNTIEKIEKELLPISKTEFKNNMKEINNMIDELEKMYDIH
ncbi:hypothetical protein LCGC14_0195170 [marine sediment metagenome]|uniref:Uncharacterized protein n=1 Tax=marine sediment metagenome TaxID=412755 RepID=A0A0F9UPW5_9ZZZZ